jgi:hypothetical protein
MRLSGSGLYKYLWYGGVKLFRRVFHAAAVPHTFPVRSKKPTQNKKGGFPLSHRLFRVFGGLRYGRFAKGLLKDYLCLMPLFIGFPW